jgi:hypothetical protein
MANYNLIDLADTLKSAADTIIQRIQDDDTLTYPQVQELTNKGQALLSKAEALYQQATIDIANDGLNALDNLKNATGEINKAIKTIATVQTVIDITAKLISLAGSILTGNFNGIVGDVGDIVNSLVS